MPADAFSIAAVFVLGTLIGSFLNVVVLRYNTGRLKQALLGGGRSACFSCDKPLAWYELIPILSFLAQGGRCRSCKSRLSWQYPIVELLSGALFVIAFLHETAPAPLLLSLVSLSLLVVIGAYDLRHKIIPDGLVYAFAAISLVYAFLLLPSFMPVAFFSAAWPVLAAGPLLALPFCLLWKFSKGRWIGLGDGKLALGMGWFLGLAGGISAVVLAFWVGAVVAIAILVIQRCCPSLGTRWHMKSEIPFAPFLILATVIVYATGVMPTGIVLFVQNLF